MEPSGTELLQNRTEKLKNPQRVMQIAQQLGGIPDDLVDLIETWGTLPDEVRQAINAMVMAGRVPDNPDNQGR